MDRERLVETCDVIFRPHLREGKQQDAAHSRQEVIEGIVRVSHCTGEQDQGSHDPVDGGHLESEQSGVTNERQAPSVRMPWVGSTPVQDGGIERRVGKNGREYVTSGELAQFFDELCREEQNEVGDGCAAPVPPTRNSSLAKQSTSAGMSFRSTADVLSQNEGRDRTLTQEVGTVDARDCERASAVALMAWSDNETVLEPKTRREALNSEQREEWQQAELVELEAHRENNTWTECKKERNQRTLTVKWVYALKKDKEGKIERFKARLVARGFGQRPGTDFNVTFAPVVSSESLRVILALCAIRGWNMRQFDVSTAFLNGVLEEEIYIEPPEGLELPPGHCLKLNKALYGLKQSPKCWNSKFTEELSALGFGQATTDQCVYHHKDWHVIVLVYVDDGLVFAETADKCEEVIDLMNRYFKTKKINTGMFLGMEIDRRDNKMTVSQRLYIRELLDKFKMVDCSLSSTPMVNAKDLMNVTGGRLTTEPYRQLVGSLQYIASKTRPDIVYPVNFLSKFLIRAEEKHWTAAKGVLRYLKTTMDYGLVYGTTDVDIEAYSDADFGNDPEKRQSTSGILVLLGGGPVVFSSRKQSNIPQSTAEAEYVAACETCKELVWVTNLLAELGIMYKRPTLWVDNQSAIRQIRNSETLRRSKHVELKYHYVREKYKSELFEVKHVSTKN